MVKNIAAVAVIAIVVFLLSVMAISVVGAQYLDPNQPTPVVEYGPTPS